MIRSSAGNFIIPNPNRVRNFDYNCALKGGKSRGLYFLSGIRGIRTPDFFTVSTGAFSNFVSANGRVRAHSAALDRMSVEYMGAIFRSDGTAEKTLRSEISGTASNAREAVRSLRLPAAFASALKSASREESLIGSPVAFRSSCVGEDSLLSSFSGQYESVTDKMPDEYEESLLSVWESFFFDRAVFSRIDASMLQTVLKGLRAGIDPKSMDDAFIAANFILGHSATPMEVIVQKMINGLFAGTCFSLDPSTMKSGALLELSEKGSQIVDGNELPKIRIFIERDGKVSGEHKIPERLLAQISSQAFTVFENARRYFGYPYIDTEIAAQKGSDIPYFIQARPYLISCIAPQMELVPGLEPIYKGGMPIVQRPGIGRLLVALSHTFEDQRAIRRDIRSGDIIVTDKLHANLSDMAHMLSGIVAEMGGLTCHAANVANQHTIPCLVGAVDAVKTLLPFNGQTATLSPGERTIYLGNGEFRSKNTSNTAKDTGSTDTSNARFDTEIDGVKYFGKPRYPLTGFQLQAYEEAFRIMNKALKEFFGISLTVPHMLADKDPDGKTIYAKCSDISSVSCAIRDLPDLSGIFSWLRQRQSDVRRFFDACGTFELTEKGIDELFGMYSTAISYFHLRGTVLHALEARCENLLSKYGVSAESFKSLQGCLFSEGRTIETKRLHDDFLALLEKAKNEPAFRISKDPAAVSKELERKKSPVMGDITAFSQSYLIMTTEDIRLTPETVRLETISRLLSSLDSEPEHMPANTYISLHDLQEILGHFGSEEEVLSFLQIARLMHDLNFENEFEHHGQPRAQWVMAKRLIEKRPDIGQALLEMPLKELKKAVTH